METILRLRGQISQQPGFQPDDQPNSQPEKRTDCQIDSQHNASKGQQDVSHESDIAWQVDIPFQAIQYMPPEVQAIWRGEESTMSVPGVGSIAAGRSQQREGAGFGGHYRPSVGCSAGGGFGRRAGGRSGQRSDRPGG